MKKGLSLLLCVLLIAASAAVIGIVPLNASANSVTNDSFSLDFENGSTPFDGTAMWSDATVQEFSSNAVPAINLYIWKRRAIGVILRCKTPI